MKIIYNNLIPFKGYKAINLFGLVFVRKGAKFTEVDYTLNTYMNFWAWVFTFTISMYRYM